MKNNYPVTFFAMLYRMKYIERWGLMRNTEKENLKEHTFDVALLAHALCEIRQAYFPEEQPQPDPGKVVLYAIYHDASEIITGDMPTPVKYFNSQMRTQYSKVENYAIVHLLNMLPEKLQQRYAEYFPCDLNNLSNNSNLKQNEIFSTNSVSSADNSNSVDAEVDVEITEFSEDSLIFEENYLQKMVKEADRLAAYIKCIIEIKQGNTEFVDAAEATKAKLINDSSPELQWFLENILPAYQLNLDQLQVSQTEESI
ncbi:MAG: 5'-deoxynucleotidase [Clostridiaceae bacterium]|mgnify:CR=1 FL=1|nr:5'-deoxynucleotidase [Clostridiaceae bacterium]